MPKQPKEVKQLTHREIKKREYKKKKNLKKKEEKWLAEEKKRVDEKQQWQPVRERLRDPEEESK